MDLHAGVDVKKKTTRVNLVIVLAVLLFFALGTAFMIKLIGDPPTAPADTSPLTP